MEHIHSQRHNFFICVTSADPTMDPPMDRSITSPGCNRVELADVAMTAARAGPGYPRRAATTRTGGLAARGERGVGPPWPGLSILPPEQAKPGARAVAGGAACVVWVSPIRFERGLCCLCCERLQVLCCKQHVTIAHKHCRRTLGPREAVLCCLLQVQVRRRVHATSTHDTAT